jgi:prepilin-type N-terminal cleavage/methylation domain-containing protein
MLENPACQSRSRGGFTLIELLIVIAIILILIAIALPNFLVAQIRARVTKAEGELRSLSIAMESYYLDYNVYPAEHERNGTSRILRGLFWLTSPNAYISSIPEDPFAEFGADSNDGITYITYEMGGLEYGTSYPQCPACQAVYTFFSNGPDVSQEINQKNPHYNTDRRLANYSPTNGTKSRGDIYLWGGDSWWIGINFPVADRGAAKSHPRVGLLFEGQVFNGRFPPE